MITKICDQAGVVRFEIMKSPTQNLLDLLDELITEIHLLNETNHKFVQLDEIMSDLEWIELYYEKKEWNNVTRWLTNIDSSLREMWSQYIKQIIARKKQTNT